MAKSLNSINSKEDLLTLQEAFAEIIRRPLIDYNFMQEDNRTNEIIIPNSKSTPHQRLQFYARQYWWRIIHSFNQDFPSVRKLLDEKTFNSLRDDYLNNYKSISYTLRDLGSRYPEFLGDKNKLLSDAAKFDWARIEAFDFAYFKPITAQDIESDNFEKEKLYLQPHVRLIKLDYPINSLNKDGFSSVKEYLSNTFNTEDEVDNSSKPFENAQISKSFTFLAIHRLKGKIYSKELTSSTFKMLSSFIKGINLEDLFKKENNLTDEEIRQFFTEVMSLKWLYKK